jgi:ferrochelatase
VVEIPAIAWKPILHGLILRTRPRRSAEAYNQVWTNEGSPLAVIARRQAQALRESFEGRASVHYAMRYGNPGIAAALANMVEEGCTRILAAPLYPQYCAATTATASDAVFAVLAGMRVQPGLRTLPPYYDDPLYIEALSANLARQIDALDFEPERLLLSFHGMPQRTLQLGDPYHCHCLKTARLVSEALGQEVDVAFQSRFGRAKWLEPATDATLAAYPRKGIKRLAVAAPGFSADCLETLEELGIRGRDSFLKSGGERFALLDCLNDSPESIAMLERLIERELAGWLPQT